MHIHALLLPYTYDSVPETCIDRCKFLRTLLTHLPSLRSLSSLSNWFGNETEAKKLALASYLNESPLPILPLLEDMEIIGYPDLEFRPFFFARYLPQLKSVHLQLSDRDSTTRSQMKNMTRLEELTLFYSSPDSWNYCNYLRLDDLNSPLKMIDLTLNRGNGLPQTFLIDKFLRSVRHLPLIALRIKVLNGITVMESGELSLDEYKNESIQFFALEYFHEHMMVSFNFLQALSTIDSIKLSHKRCTTDLRNQKFLRRHPPGIPEKIQLYRYFYQQGVQGDPYTMMYQSNIWELVPSLKVLCIQGSLSYIRVQYNGLVGKTCVSFKAQYSRNVYEELKN